jgi:hypothetical protein
MAATVDMHRSGTNSTKLQVRDDRAKSKIVPKFLKMELYKENEVKKSDTSTNYISQPTFEI